MKRFILKILFVLAFILGYVSLYVNANNQFVNNNQQVHIETTIASNMWVHFYKPEGIFKKRDQLFYTLPIYSPALLNLLANEF